MVRKYVVKCRMCNQAFTHEMRWRAIAIMKTHAKKKHGVDLTTEQVEYTVEEVETPEETT